MKTDPGAPSTTVPFVMAWSAVCAYGLLLMATQVLWLTYAPVTSQVHETFGVSEGAVGDLAVVVPILYVLLGMQAGRWLDRHFTKTMVAGTGLVVAGALIRAVDASSYAYALTGQIILSAGLPLFANAITKIPARHLPPGHHVRAISLLTASQILGILVAASTGSWLYERGGLDLLVGSHAALTVVAGAVMLCSLAIRPRFAAPERAAVARINLRRNRQMCLLAGQAFIGLGLFNALATWLETIQSGFGNEGWGGPMVTVMTVAGIVGAATVPALATHLGRRRAALTLIGAGTTIATAALLLAREPVPAMAAIAVVGFLLISGLPIALEWSESLVGPEHAGTAAAFILVIANLGGSLYVVSVQLFIHNSYAAVLVLTLLVLPWTVLARLQARDTPTSQHAALPSRQQ